MTDPTREHVRSSETPAAHTTPSGGEHGHSESPLDTSWTGFIGPAGYEILGQTRTRWDGCRVPRT